MGKDATERLEEERNRREDKKARRWVEAAQSKEDARCIEELLTNVSQLRVPLTPDTVSTGEGVTVIVQGFVLKASAFLTQFSLLTERSGSFMSGGVGETITSPWKNC